MRSRPSILASSSGYTLVELLVASTIGLLVLSLALANTISNQSLFKKDLIRTRLNQQLRSALDIIGINTREAGENLTAAFPALEIIDGGPGAPDELVLRRNLKDEVLSLCQTITSEKLYFAIPGTTSGCIYGDNLFNFNQWSEERTSAGGEIKIYLYDSSTKLGEFVDYINEVDTGTELYLEKSGALVNTYTVGSTAMYVLEEWRFKVSGDLLQVEENGDVSAPLNVVAGVEDFQAQAILGDGTVLDEFTVDDDWTEVSAIEVRVSGADSFGGKQMVRELSARFFPRNVLSN